MLTFANLEAVKLAGPAYITIGNFDGLHRGHRALLRQLQRLAAAAVTSGRLSVRPQTGIVTFSPHPLAVLRPEVPHFLLTTPTERLDLAATEGLDFGVVQPFSHALAALDARAFMQLLKTQLNLVGLVVGPDFALGRSREGNLDRLRALGEELDYTLHVIEPIDWQGLAVRSSAIRLALQDGNVALAANLLGRDYTADGEVVTGDQRGRQIGIPTANLQVSANKLLPANGVYATRSTVLIDGAAATFPSVTNLGVRPTVDGLHRRLETHLLDFPPAGHSGDLYGQPFQLAFVAHLRPEQRFSGLDALVAQIHADIAHARDLFALSPAV